MNSERYDRQLRAWGVAGQQRLQKSRLLILGYSPTASEVLKNLVLAGLGSFTFVDDGQVASDDVDVDFFLPLEAVGKLRAATVVEAMAELNPAVTGVAVALPVDHFIASLSEPARLSFDIILYINGMIHTQDPNFSDLLWQQNTPLVRAACQDLQGAVNICMQQHIVWDQDPQSKEVRMDLLSPFQELIELSHTISASLTSKEAISVKELPYPLLFGLMAREGRTINHETLEAYCKDHGCMYRLPELKGCLHREIRQAHTLNRTWLSIAKISNRHPRNGTFWRLFAAVDNFRSMTGRFPLAGTVSDIECDPEIFRTIKQIYLQKSAEDIAKVVEIVANAEFEELSWETIADFCRRIDRVSVLYYDDKLENPDLTSLITFKKLPSCIPLAWPPTIARIGGIAAAEIIKICTGCYSPQLNKPIAF